MITNKQVKQYEPLVHKIAHQFEASSKFQYEDLIQYGYEGLLYAFKTYKEDKKQTFQQYAGWQIRYAILNANNTEGNIIKHGYYQRKTNKQLTINSIDCDDNYLQLEATNSCDIQKLHKTIESTIEMKFSNRDCDIFYRTFGLKHYEYEKSKDVAKIYNISNASVTLINQKIINYIKEDDELMDMLRELLY